MDTLQQQQKTKRSSFLANVPTQRRIDEDEKRNNNYRSSVNDIQVEASISSGYSSKRSSFAGYRRPTSISSIHNLTNNNNSRYSRNSFLGDDSVDYDYDNNEQNEDWETILKQYDRYGMTDDDKRKSKRASRLMESYQETPVQVPKAEEPTFILDCYDFPPAFKTHHLHDIFRGYESNRGGYKIKWLSDTRALIIFDNPAIAKKAYIDNVTHALAKIRPYDGPTDFLRDPNQNQQKLSRPMSMDFKRQSFNLNPSRSSKRSSMKVDENDIKRLSIAQD